MTRFILVIFAIFSGLGLAFSAFASIASRHDGLTQAILALALGISSLIFIVSIGLSSLLGLLQSQNARVETALKDIAASNADSAIALKALVAVAEQPARAAEAAADEEKRARMSAYRAQLQEKTPGGRLAVEAAMLAERDGEKGAL